MSEEREQYSIIVPKVDAVAYGGENKIMLAKITTDDESILVSNIGKWNADCIKKVALAFDPVIADAHAVFKKLHALKKVAEAPYANQVAQCKTMTLARIAELAEFARREQARINAEAEEQARRDRARLEKEAARLKTPERKQERLEMAAAIIPVAATVQSAPARVAGEVHSSTWKAELLSLGELLEAAVTNELALSFVAFDQSAADKLARATKGAVNVPGVRFVESKSISYRSK